MLRKALPYIVSFTLSGLAVYLDYILVREIAWHAATLIHPGIPKPPVYTLVRYFFYLTGAFIIFVYLAYFNFYLYYRVATKGEEIDPRFFPRVSVVIPAYNEAKNIERAIESIRYQDYPSQNVEIIVVDDGSQDDTAKVAERLGAKVIVHDENLGKAAAIESGVKAASGDVVITMDADTYLETGSSLRLLVSSLFSDDRVGVATGIIRIRLDRGSLIEKLQDLEFMHGFELGRRVQSHLDWLLVVPGAFSAFKGEFIKSLASIPKDTLAEDFMLALIAYRRGLTSRLQPRAVAFTNAKQSWRSLYKQRVRWFYGGLQVMARNADMLLNTRYGEKGIFLFIHNVLIEYVIPILFAAGVVVLPLMLALQKLAGIPFVEVSLPADVAAIVLSVVYLLQHLPGIFMSTLLTALERGASRVVSYLPAIIAFYLFYIAFLSIAKIDAMVRFFKGVVETWA